ERRFFLHKCCSSVANQCEKAVFPCPARVLQIESNSSSEGHATAGVTRFGSDWYSGLPSFGYTIARSSACLTDLGRNTHKLRQRLPVPRMRVVSARVNNRLLNCAVDGTTVQPLVGNSST